MTDPIDIDRKRERVSIRWLRENGELYEHRRRVVAIVECPRCGADVECIGETEEWHLKRSRWHHTVYGPGTGECCDQIIVDTYDGAFVLCPTR